MSSKNKQNNYKQEKKLSTQDVISVLDVRALASVGVSVSNKEKRIICILSKSSKRIVEYKINNNLYRDCDLFKFPKVTQVNPKNFTLEDSPLIFSNIISYKVGNEVKVNRVKNEFYVSSITNYPEKLFVEYKFEEFCGERNMFKTRYFKKYSPDKFYIRYERGMDTYKH